MPSAFIFNMQRSFFPRQAVGIFFITGLVVLLISGCRLLPFSANGPRNASANPALERAYEKKLLAVLAPYWQQQAVDNVKAGLLELRAPAKYLDLHLGLVLAFEKIQEGTTTGTQSEVADGVEQLESLVRQYPWIK